MEIAESNLHPGCIDCKLRNRAPQDVIDPETGRIVARKGDFAIKCKGIPADSVASVREMLEEANLPQLAADAELFASVADPVLWAKKNITVFNKESSERGPWIPQRANPVNIERYNLDETANFYQELMVKCTANRQLYRLGRRSGKSWTIGAKVLHKMITNKNYRVLVITPNISQLDLLFDQINDFIEHSPSLKECCSRYVKSPQRRIELTNGSYMVGFVSGNESIRGQAADMIIIDEADYLTSNDLSAIVAILSEHKDTILLAASTPSGAHEQFYKWDHDPCFRSFHYPSMCRPNWDEDMEFEQRMLNPGVKYLHEILAEYGEIEEGVFQHTHIDAALADGTYKYEDSEPDPSFIYCFGVDWNPVHGTEVVVIGADPTQPHPVYKVYDVGQVYREGNTQIQAINEIIRLNRKWNPAWIYVDRGAGSVQIEMLQDFGTKSAPNTADKRLQSIIKAIDFGSKIEMRHPTNGSIIKQYAKPAVVENAVRIFESGQIGLSKYDGNLIRALRGYIIEKISKAGAQPTYAMINDDIEDHRLDAFMLGLFAFTMEFSKLGTPAPLMAIRFTGMPGEIAVDISKNISIPTDRSNRPVSRTGEKKDIQTQIEAYKERELNFIPTRVVVESDTIAGQQVTRVTHIPDQSRSRHIDYKKRNSRAPIKRSAFR